MYSNIPGAFRSGDVLHYVGGEINDCLADYLRIKKKYVIASQSADWRGNLPVLPAFFVRNRNILPFNGGIATALRASH